MTPMNFPNVESQHAQQNSNIVCCDVKKNYGSSLHFILLLSSCYRSTLVQTEGLLYDQLQLKDGVTPSAYSFIACSTINFTI